jgi:hypothetical protein
VNESNFSAFADAITDGAVDRVLQLIRAGVNFALRADLDLTEDGPELLKLAVEAELDRATRSGEEPHVDMTVLLMIGGADPRRPVDGVSALDLASARGHWLGALVMDRWGRAPTAESGVVSPPEDDLLDDLVQAIEHDRFRTLHDLLAAGADVHAEVSGESLLVYSMDSEETVNASTREIHVDSSALLLAMGADPFRPPRGATGPTPAQRAAERFYAPDILLYERWTRLWGSRG